MGDVPALIIVRASKAIGVAWIGTGYVGSHFGKTPAPAFPIVKRIREATIAALVAHGRASFRKACNAATRLDHFSAEIASQNRWEFERHP
jgi:hypothetical protein